MIFEPGTYYVGDPGFVLPNEDLRMLFSWSMDKCLKSGTKQLTASSRWENGKLISDVYWFATTPAKSGTLYDKDNVGWGFDWGCFGLVPWKWVTCSGTYEKNQITFAKPFECSYNEDGIKIGNLQFTFNPK